MGKKELNLDKLNNLNFTKVDLKKFPLVKILKTLKDLNYEKVSKQRDLTI